MYNTEDGVGSSPLGPQRMQGIMNHYTGILKTVQVRHEFRLWVGVNMIVNVRRHRHSDRAQERDAKREKELTSDNGFASTHNLLQRNKLKLRPYSKQSKSPERSKPSPPIPHTLVVSRTSRTRQQRAGSRTNYTQRTTQSCT